MKFPVIAIAAAAIGLVSVGVSQSLSPEHAVIEQRFQERALVYEAFLAGNSREGLQRLLALSVPEGVSKDLFLIQELARLSLEFSNAQERKAATLVASLAADLLSPDNVFKLHSRAERAEAWRMLAMIHERILPDRASARAAWQLALVEEPEDERAAKAIRRIDERASFIAKLREEAAKDPMGPGFIPNPVPPAVKP